jgi:transposase
MGKKKRHSLTEIEAKLREATALAAAGRTQSEIAKALGVSVMTLHRWRKAMPKAPGGTGVMLAVGLGEASNYASETGRTGRISELQLENARLRKLVTDLLLEKMKLEEVYQGSENGQVTLKKA